MQGIVYRKDDARFAGKSLEEALTAALADPACAIVNRNSGSGTRIVVDALLGARRPSGYAVQVKSHNAVAAAIQQRRADWGLAINTVAGQYGLGFIPVHPERFDFAVPTSRLARPAVRAFRELLNDAEIRKELRALGFDA
jgi:putative molybdopterin biosynthesis protein